MEDNKKVEWMGVYGNTLSLEFRRDKEEAILRVQELLNEWNEKESEQCGRSIIQTVKGRVKTPKSIIEKLKKKNYDLTMEEVERLNDLAGVRAVCSFIDDVYELRDYCRTNKYMTILNEKDFIQEPKSTGYQSLHLIMEVKLASGRVEKVELQIRTVVMDWWSGLEHKMVYKQAEAADKQVKRDLLTYASWIVYLDRWLLELREMRLKAKQCLNISDVINSLQLEI